MKYSTEQYYNMVVHVETSILDAELHNSRIMKRLEEEAELKALHARLNETLLNAVGIISNITALLDIGMKQTDIEMKR